MNANLKKIIPDKLFLMMAYKKRLGRNLNITAPTRFNEKIQWLKLFDRNPFYTQMVDKCEVKKYIADWLGEEYVIPTLGIWERFEDIDFKTLPDKFVLKSTHDSGGVIICESINKFDIDKARKIINKSLSNNYYYLGREWPYKNVKPRIIAEEYMTDESKTELKDYKVFIFNGVPKFIQVDFDRFTNHRRNFYSTNWEYVPFTTCYPTNPDRIIEKPSCLYNMLDAASTISKMLNDPAFLRTDFYIIGDTVKFGEITFYHGSGYEQFYPDEYDYKLGEMINLEKLL